jgi:hypothetical protein
MTNFINIKDDENAPVMVDVSDFAVLLDCKAEHQEGLYFSDAQQGRILHIDAQDWGVDVDNVAGKIRNAGVNLIKLPNFWGEQDSGNYYVNPAQVDVVTMSAPRQRQDGKDYVSLTASVKRGMFVETSIVPLDIAQGFVTAIKKANANIVEITPDMAMANIARDGFTLIDPTQVKTLCPNGDNEMRVTLNSGDGLCFRVVKHGEISKARNAYLNRLVNRLQGNGSMDDLVKSIGGLDVLLPRLDRYAALYAQNLKERFTQAVFANVDGLVKMNKAADFYYVRADEVAMVRTAGDTGISLSFNKSADQQYADTMIVDYNNAEDALSGIKQITTLKATL